MLELSIVVSLPFVLAAAYGLLLAWLLVQRAKPRQAFLLAFTLGLVGGGLFPGLVSAGILRSGWLGLSVPNEAWFEGWRAFSTFLLAPFLSAAIAALGARAFSARRLATVRRSH
jgi:hypothetical protein